LRLSRAQKFIRWFSSKEKFKKMEEESKQWRVICSCGKEMSVWEMGGIRYKAAGNPLIRVRCLYCSKVQMLKLSKTETYS
jgi:hypothetical protein